jgi:hypothetical protein
LKRLARSFAPIASSGPSTSPSVARAWSIRMKSASASSRGWVCMRAAATALQMAIIHTVTAPVGADLAATLLVHPAHPMRPRRAVVSFGQGEGI